MSWGEILFGLYVLVLSGFVGFEIISKVPTMLHTPLMSGANAISGIIFLGSLMVVAQANSYWGLAFGYGALFFASINIFGGFVVTDRMLSMFRAKKKGRH